MGCAANEVDLAIAQRQQALLDRRDQHRGEIKPFGLVKTESIGGRRHKIRVGYEIRHRDAHSGHPAELKSIFSGVPAKGQVVTVITVRATATVSPATTRGRARPSGGI